MKLRLLTCVTVASAALFANESTDSATYGILAVSDTTTTNTVVGVPWVNVGEGNVTLSNLVSTATLADNDMVYFYEGTTWYSYKVQGGVFVPVETVSSETQTSPSAANVKTFARGTGLIIQRANTTNPIYLCGRYDTTPPTATSVPAGSQALIANPKTETVYITAGATGDKISVPGNGGTRTDYVKKDDGWYGTVTETPTGFLFPVTSQQKFNDGVPLAAGKGAFYTNNGNAAVEISW